MCVLILESRTGMAELLRADRDYWRAVRKDQLRVPTTPEFFCDGFAQLDDTKRPCEIPLQQRSKRTGNS